ncbi:ciliary-associated calcium-binding coiled-coil protein 1 [Fundulus heteroclitus]|uniref:ciliary-associated calcium-binding coiled-coil protein 1 n=1 Tax=Fundulus heteroclitus TaxID=8078 RepID=UPI000644E958|nr:ciliary-associated calcium-binding coiled-coil protein 1 [Fundulus heteroclitus]
MSGEVAQLKEIRQLKVNKKQEAGFLQDMLPLHLIRELQKHSAEELLHKMENILGFTNHRTCIKEAVLFHYYLSGFSWATEVQFTHTQTCFTMAVLHMLLKNLTEKQMNSVDNMVAFMEAMAAAWHPSPSDEDTCSVLDNDEATELIGYVTKSLILKNRLYGCLFTISTQSHLTGMERTMQRLNGQDTFTPLEESIFIHLSYKLNQRN